MTTTDERMLTTAEVATRLRCSRGTVWLLVRDGLLPATRYRANGNFHVPASAVEDFLRRAQTQSRPLIDALADEAL